MVCEYGNQRCLCQDCKSNAKFDDCKSGFCINCFECEDAGKMVHDMFLCTGYKKREDTNDD